MNNFKILKELIKRFQGVRAVLYFAEIIGMGVAVEFRWFWFQEL